MNLTTFRASIGRHLPLHGSLILLVPFINTFAGPLGGRGYPALWYMDGNVIQRSVALFDLCNGLWLGWVLPAAILTEAKPHLVRDALDAASRRDGKSWWSLAPFTVVPFVVFLRTAFGEPALVDTLPAVWWLNKFAAFLVWTAGPEELVYRILALGSALAALRTLTDRHRSAAAVALVTVVFTIAHVGAGWGSVTLAASMGVVFGTTIVRGGGLAPCVLAHALANTLGATWN